MENLINYVAKLQDAVLAEQEKTGSFYTCRVEAIGACKTLWIPVSTSNRIVSIDLNHTINGFNEAGELWGENGNCGTAYRIIEIPSFINDQLLKEIGEIVNIKCENKFPQWYNAMRASNVDLIIETIKEFEIIAFFEEAAKIPYPFMAGRIYNKEEGRADRDLIIKILKDTNTINPYDYIESYPDENLDKLCNLLYVYQCNNK